MKTKGGASCIAILDDDNKQTKKNTKSPGALPGSMVTGGAVTFAFQTGKVSFPAFEFALLQMLKYLKIVIAGLGML